MTESFSLRHIGTTHTDVVGHMVATLNQNNSVEPSNSVQLDSVDALVDAAVPADIRQQEPLALDAALSEAQTLARLRELAGKNQLKTQLIGQGYYDTITPAVLRRNILENPAWYTAYTPYQPEISQGRLEALLNFQTLVQDLTGLPIANASLLDEATAVVEAMLLMRRANRKHAAGLILADTGLHPQTQRVLAGRAEAVGIELRLFTPGTDELPADELCGLILQQPDSSGLLRDDRELIAAAKERGALVTVATDLLALTLLLPPGEQGADIAVGSAQRFGVPLFFGGPHAAFMAVQQGLERSLPGRLVGVSHDDVGTPAYRLALQTREQHIRREKATSNICTAQALLAVVASMYAVYHGPEGLRAIAERVHGYTAQLATALQQAGVEVLNQSFFDTLSIRVPGRAQDILGTAAAAGYNLRLIDTDTLGVSLDETTEAETVAAVSEFFGASAGSSSAEQELAIPAPLQRTSEYLTHPVFHSHRSETQMLRYLRRLADRDLALDRTMIPLGSCTMKLNAAVEMEAISWPEFASIHPFAPAEQTAGWQELIAELEADLATVTGYDNVSIQPNAGSQGELAGLLAIRDYHASRGDTDRTVCLIPASAHGTNAASAVLAGLKVVVVNTAEDGSVDHADLQAKLEQNAGAVAAIMITYPSTHGVYDADVRYICEAVHNAGGQVYVDGANLNALLGLAQPGQFGGDVSHLNLHKTFCIPHGGGGPGVGPVAVKKHLAPFLPGNANRVTGDDADASGRGGRSEESAGLGAGQEVSASSPAGTPISASQYGSAGVLPISWAYIKLMGASGLTEATKSAILAANYIAARLNEYFPVLYTGNAGLVAHECILDLRQITDATGVSAEDVAKRLIDYGFHAPTLAFPVAGTLMVEPTESEDLAELDRFIDAMIAIKAEIDAITAGDYSVEDSPLRHAPHTASAVVNSDWDRAYSRERAVFPVPGLQRDKYFPPVGRIDGTYGDRNLVCACPPPEAFEN